MDDTGPLDFLFCSTTPIDFGVGFWVAILVLLLLLIASALISGSEVAFFSFTPEDKEGIRESTEPSIKTSLKLLNSPKDLLATILITNNFVNVAIVILSSYIFNQIYPENPLLEGVA